MGSPYLLDFYNKIISQQEGIAASAEKMGNAAKAKNAYNQMINAYNKLIAADPSNKSEYNDKIRDIKDKIENLANLPAPTPATPNAGAQKQNNNNNKGGNNSGVKKADNRDPKDSSTKGAFKPSGNVDEEELAAGLKELNDLVGLHEVKEQINKWVNQIKVFQERKARGIPVSPMTYHMVFTGNPGTGKTTVARLVAKIYHGLGIIAGNDVDNFTIETDREGLVSGFVGQTATKTKEVIDKAYGGILFIDEAYTLKPKGDGNDFGQEAIDTLLKAMEDRRDELVVIAAGYEDDMKRFISSNAGLSSRFKNFINFGDYNGEDLYKIFSKQAKKYEYRIPAECDVMLKNYFVKLYKDRDENFGNARTVRNFFESLVTAQANRLTAKGISISSLSDEDLRTFTTLDVENCIHGQNLSEDEFKKIEDNYRRIKLENSNEILERMISDDYSEDGLFDESLVKLSVRLESILKFKYRLEGTLDSMIESLIKLNKNEPKYQILHKLRIARNLAAHEGKKVELSLTDVNNAFNIIKELDA